MGDRELLEAAAKAVGLVPAAFVGNADYMDGLLSGSRPWNPLTDDGDALRLAVKLRLHIDHESGNGGLLVWMYPEDRKQIASFDERNDTDPCAATRRAIVRAAAALGAA
jgi:hypothetical protein